MEEDDLCKSQKMPGRVTILKMDAVNLLGDMITIFTIPSKAVMLVAAISDF